MMPGPAPTARQLDEAEFNAIRDRLLDEAPDGLSETDFNRWMTPRLEAALAEAEYTPPPVTGSALGRFAAGAASMLNPVEMAKGVYQTVRHPVDTVTNLAAAHGEQFTKAREAFQGGNVVEAVGHAAAGALPVVGPMAAAVGEQIGGGDVAGGLGSATGLLLPAAARPTAAAAGRAVPGTLRERLATMMRRGAEGRVADVMTPKVGPNKTRLGGEAAKAAPGVLDDLIAEGGVPWSVKGLRERAMGRLGDAEQALDAAADARSKTRTFETSPIVQALRGKRGRLTAEAVDASAVPPKVTTRPSAILDDTGRPFTVTEASPQPLGRDVVPAPNAERVAMLDQAAGEIAELGPVAGFEPLRRIRQAYDGPAKAVYSPSVTADYLKAQGGKLGAADVAGVLREHLTAFEPGTAVANAQYALWRRATDVLDAVAEVERARPTVGRQIAGRVLSTFMGGQAGGAAGAAAGFALAPVFEGASSATTKLQTARLMGRLATAIRKQRLAEVTTLTDELAALAPTMAIGAAEER